MDFKLFIYYKIKWVFICIGFVNGCVFRFKCFYIIDLCVVVKVNRKIC